ncbi:hypothetical protein P692DRAFT_20195585 [Suillus brevipes Sb2]|nr:hypothetical protein P692DRAFT_20195585 [Suillus brevipes Sb2]
MRLIVYLVVRSALPAPSLDIMTGRNKTLQRPLFRAMIRACLMAGEAYIAAVIGMSTIAGMARRFPLGESLWDSQARPLWATA